MATMIEDLENKIKFILDDQRDCCEKPISEADHKELLENYTQGLRSGDPYLIEHLRQTINKYYLMTRKAQLQRGVKKKIAITACPPANDAE